MAFVLEAMTQADHALIFSPDNATLMAKYCGVYNEWKSEAKSAWAIDRATGTVFYRLPTWAPRDSVDRFLLVFDMTSIVVQMTADETVLPLDLPARLVPRLEEVRQAIRDAFVVHGFFGVAPTGAVDIPTPTFQ